MELDTIFGLPAHPLLVHIPVMLIPLTTIAVLAALVVVRWRRWLAVIALGLGVVALAGTYLVQESGDPLEERVEDNRPESDLIEEHTHMGDELLPFVGVFVVLLAGAAWAARDGRRLAAPLAALALLGGAASTVEVVRIGHSGAKAAWEDVTSGSGTGSGSDDDGGRERNRDDDDDDDSLGAVVDGQPFFGRSL